MDRDQLRENLHDLWLAIPYMQIYEVADWVLMASSVLSILLTVKSRIHGLLVLSIVDLAWGLYDLYQGGYAQGIVFFLYFSMTMSTCVRWYLSNEERKKHAL